jgi:MSHA biogenesis protein MshO
MSCNLSVRLRCSRRKNLPAAAGRQKGFTIIELVAVIVLLGIVGIASSQFIRQGVQVYVDSARRDDLQQQARFAVERVTREVKNALPGSVRVLDDGTNQCVEFIPIIAATTYMNFIVNSTISQLEVAAMTYNYVAGDQLAIYTFDNNSVYDTASITAITGIVDGAIANTQILSFNALTIVNDSPTKRAYIVAGAISFCVSDGQLRRHQNYIVDGFPPSAADGIPVAENIRVSEGAPVTVFSFSAGSLQRAGALLLDFRFQDPSASDEWLRFSQTVLVKNVP